MKFRKFLRQIFGGRLHAERLHLFRKCLNKSFRDEKKTDDLIAKFNREGVDRNWDLVNRPHILEWRKGNRIQQRRDANKKRWLKEKAIDSVEQVQN